MKVLFVIFHGFDPNNGISKKISYQLNAFKECGAEAHICFMDENNTKKRIIDQDVIIDYGNGLKSKFLKRTDFSSIIHHAVMQQIDMVYLRSNHNANPFTIRMVRKMKKAGMKVVMEIPTYPYDEEYKNWSIWQKPISDRLFRKSLAKNLDAIVTFSNEDYIFGQHTIKISNGIDFNNVIIKPNKNDTSKELNLIGVAEIHTWHGFDRIVRGLANYYSKPQKYLVFFHVVGYFFSIEIENEFKDLIKKYHMEKYVILYGRMHGKELDNLFFKCDFGIGSLGRHRVGITTIKTLKNREYAARGIPFVYSETDDDFDQQPYVLKVPADESDINIDEIITFYHRLSMSPLEIRESIHHLSWKHQMGNVLNTIYPTNKNHKKLAYCIPSLDRPSGMERVLTIKANYLAENLAYDVAIITTDSKGIKPFFPISPKIRLIQLDINIDDLWKYPVWKKAFIYFSKIRSYKSRLDDCLKWIKPDITISLLRREINFICDIKDGSAKVGEIHFGRYKYREVNLKFLPSFINQWITARWMGQLERNLIRLDKFVVLTHEDKDQWKGLDNLCVISNPITILSESQSNCQNKQAIAVGRYTYQKGFDLLIQAWRIVHQDHPDWILNVYGGGNKEDYQKQANELGLQDVINCNGPVNNIVEKYQESSIFILSSRFEGFGLVLAEAMSAGVAPVAFACPCGPRDIIHNGEDGILCENGNISELAKGICSLIEDEEKRKRMGLNAAKNIQRYCLDNIMHQWDDLFQGIIKQKG